MDSFLPRNLSHVCDLWILARISGLASLIPFHLQTWSCQQPCRLTNTFFIPLSQAKTCTHDATSPLPHHKKFFFSPGFEGRGTKLFKAQKVFLIMPRSCISHTFAKVLSQCALWVCASRKEQRTRVPGWVMSLKFSSCATQCQRSRAVCTWPRLKTASRTAMRCRIAASYKGTTCNDYTEHAFSQS